MIQARNYTPANRGDIDLIVIHSMESSEGLQTAENVAAWFAGANAPRASAHWCHDADSSVRCVHDKDVAWGAPGANHDGIHHELAGRAGQSRGEWLDDYGRRLLAQAAGQVRRDCDRWGIPVRPVDAAGLRRGERGITTHVAVSEAFQRSDHWDPGPHFPMDEFLRLVGGTNTSPSGDDDMTPAQAAQLDELHSLLTAAVGQGQTTVTGTLKSMHGHQVEDLRKVRKIPDGDQLWLRVVNAVRFVRDEAGGEGTEQEWDEIAAFVADAVREDVAEALAGLTPEAIAAAIPDELASDVVDELVGRLAV